MTNARNVFRLGLFQAPGCSNGAVARAQSTPATANGLKHRGFDRRVVDRVKGLRLVTGR